MTSSRPAWQGVMAVLLCLFFVCAFYGSLTVQAVFGVDDIVIGGVLVASAAVLTYITVVGLSGSDLAEPLYDAANRANTDINDWLEPKVTAFLEATDGTTLIDTQIKSLVGGLSYVKDGVLYFSDALGSYIHDFGEWLIENGDISVPSTGDAEISTESVTVGGINIIAPTYRKIADISLNAVLATQGSNSVYVSSNTIANDHVYNALTSNGIVIFASADPFSCGVSGSFATVIEGSKLVLNGKTVYYAGVNSLGFDWGVEASDTSVASPAYAAGRFGWYLVHGAFSSTGVSNGLDVWNQEAPAGFAVDPTDVIGGSIGAADVPAGAIAGIGDYVQAIADAIAGIADITLPVAGVGDIPIDPAIPADISIPVTPAIPADVADAVPATGEATPAYPATGDYTLPLADFFPFCIPFDLYKMLSLLSASPQAPAFTWQFYTPGGGFIPIEVDLSAFDSVAAVLRAVETLAFCVGLGFVTKKLLFGS